MNENIEFEDDYLNCDEYKKYPVTDHMNNIALFQHNNGLFYFAVYDHNNKIKLRSEGFNTVESRQSELDMVLNLQMNPAKYATYVKAGHRVNVLLDNTGREIARSCFEKIPLKIEPVKREPKNFLLIIWQIVKKYLSLMLHKSNH